MRLRHLVAAIAASALTFAAIPARADERADLDKGRAAYLAKNYDDADARFRAMLDARSGTLHDPSYVAEARMYWAATLMAKGEDGAATPVLKSLILTRPEYEPDPLQLPQEVINRFYEVRSDVSAQLNADKLKRLREQLEKEKKERERKAKEAERLATLEKLAGEEVVTEHHSRLIALVPFGAGQFQNGDKTLGFTFLIGEAALFGAAGVVFIDYRIDFNNYAGALNANDTTEAQGWLDRAKDARIANIVLNVSAAAAALAGVIQAEVAYVPEKIERKKRNIPPPVTFAPVLTPLTGGMETGIRGGYLGIRGSF